MISWLPFIGSAISVGLGVSAIVFPSIVARIVGLSYDTEVGKSEIRATYGGLFVGLGSVALLTQSDPVFLPLGAGWGGAALVRLAFLVFGGNVQWKNVAGVLFESLMAILFLSEVI